MNWYLAKLVYQVVSGTGNHAPQFDEQWRLIWADEMSWAREKASILGQIDGFEFMNTRNEKVQWKFVNVVEVCEISSRRWCSIIQRYRRTSRCKIVS
jgi:hypothetical protein